MPGFEIDGDKLRSALPAPTSSTWDDIKMVAFVIAGPLLLLGSVLLLVVSLLARL